MHIWLPDNNLCYSVWIIFNLSTLILNPNFADDRINNNSLFLHVRDREDS